MKRFALVLIALAALITVPSFAAGPTKVAPVNKNIAVDNTTGVQGNVDVLTVLATADIKKALKHRILTISGSATTTDLCTFEIVPVINGVNGATLGLTPAHGDLKFSGALGLTICGTWGLDIDTIELANPGAFLNKPLQVDLDVTNFSRTADPSTYAGSLVVRLEKR